MNILAFDTTTGSCSVAVLAGEKSYSVTDGQPALQAEKLFSLIAEVLDQAGLGYQKLGAIAVTAGPGSFTGVRIGLAAAKGIALAADVPLIGIGSLEAIAWEARGYGGNDLPILAVMDARRNQVYAQYFSADARPLGEALLLNLDAVAQRVPQGPLILAGNGIRLVHHALPQAIMAEAITVPKAVMVAQAARDRQQSGAVEALYIREPDAKVKKEEVNRN